MGFIKNIIRPEKTYEVKSQCRQCGMKQLTKIKFGHRAEDVIQNGKCNNCGCQELELIK